MTADYYRDMLALDALIAAFPGTPEAARIRQMINDSLQLKPSVDDAHAALEAAARTYCEVWKAGGQGHFILGEALDALVADPDPLSAEMRRIVTGLRNSIRASGGGGGGNAAWPSNYVSSSS